MPKKNPPAPPKEDELRALGAVLLHPKHEHWPHDWFQGLDFPPPFLVARGNTALLTQTVLKVALVGARACTPYGQEQAKRFGSGIASSGGLVVSGAARGIDQCAMQGALSAGGPVIAVLGSGLDVPYPAYVQPLLDAIVTHQGLVLSEFPLGAKPLRHHFLKRNRLIAALSHATVVIQATRRSGSLNTAGWALSLGRDLFGVPGPVDSTVSEGVHQMLRDGAFLATGPLDIIDELGLRKSEDEPTELEILNEQDLSLEALALELGQEPEFLQMRLVELELSGHLLRLPGGLYHRTGSGAATRPPES